MTEQETTSNPAPATCDMCAGTGLYGPDAVNCPCGITPAPASQTMGSQPQHVLSVTQHPNVEGSNGEQRGTELPSQHVLATASPWQWWAGTSEEWCTVGPEDTREAIIQAATNDSLGEFQHEEGGWNLGFYIVEARQDPLRLADWIESDQLLERAEESMADSDRTSSENDDGPWFECTQEQGKDLEERVKRACDEWQAAHGLKFACSTFSHTRNQEHVVVELPDDTATTEDQP